MAVERLWQQLPSIAVALELMKSWKDKKGQESEWYHDATQHLAILYRSNLCPLSLALQDKGLDLISALDKVKSVMTVLDDMIKTSLLSSVTVCRDWRNG